MDFSFVKWTHATFNDIDSYGNHFIERYEIENLMNIQAGDYFLLFFCDRIKVIDKSAKHFATTTTKTTKQPLKWCTEMCEPQ